MSRKRKESFEQMLNENRKQILKDKKMLDHIEQKIEKRMNESL